MAIFSPQRGRFPQLSEEKLEEELKDLRQRCEDSDNMYDEVQKKVNQTEADLERADIRVEVGEFKIIEMEEELRVVANNLKSLEVSEEKSNAREASDKTTVKSLSAKLKQAEARAEFAEKSVQKLQKEASMLAINAPFYILSICRWTGWKTTW